MFDAFLKQCLLVFDSKLKQAEAIIWFHLRSTGEAQISLQKINEYFDEASLPKYNVTRAKDAFAKSKTVFRGSQEGYYRLTAATICALDREFGYLFASNPSVDDLAGIVNTPYLSDEAKEHSKKMAEVYVVFHCYENSVRTLVTRVLENKFGSNWWEIVANSSLKSKVNSRKEKESRHKWLTPRGGNQLYYVDWGDLLSIIRNFEADFIPYIKDIKFIELRFEELERVRNIIAHNGYLPNPDDFQRVIISFKDWCRQVVKTLP